MRSIADKARLVRIPVHVLEKLAKVKRNEKFLEVSIALVQVDLIQPFHLF